jgi:XTP/dITP diphosphohydrolase
MLQKEKRKNSMNFELNGKVVFFATNNFHKFNEARRVLAQHKIAVGMLRVKALEIQSDSLSDIAQASAIDAFGRCNLPVIVEDAGLFINALNGFPGPYSAYVYKTVGNAGLLKLMEGVADRKATFQSVIAYYDGHGMPVCFEGEAAGKITSEEQRGNGKSVFGFDPIFLPAGSSKVFAEMAIEEKNCYSHRAKAISKLAKWCKKPP